MPSSLDKPEQSGGELREELERDPKELERFCGDIVWINRQLFDGLLRLGEVQHNPGTPDVIKKDNTAELTASIEGCKEQLRKYAEQAGIKYEDIEGRQFMTPEEIRRLMAGDTFEDIYPKNENPWLYED